MKKLINAPEDVVKEELEGIALAHGDLVRVSYEPKYVVRADAPVQGKVGAKGPWRPGQHTPGWLRPRLMRHAVGIRARRIRRRRRERHLKLGQTGHHPLERAVRQTALTIAPRIAPADIRM